MCMYKALVLALPEHKVKQHSEEMSKIIVE